MGLNFRKIFRFGGFRTSLSKGGVGISWGIPGFRFGINSQGRKYFTIGFYGLGIYFTKTLSTSTEADSLNEKTVNAESNGNKPVTTNKTGTTKWWNQIFFKSK